MDNPFEFHEEDAIIACVGENGGTTDEDIRNGFKRTVELLAESLNCLLYTSPSPRDCS